MANLPFEKGFLPIACPALLNWQPSICQLDSTKRCCYGVCVFYFHAGWLKPSPPFRLKDLLEERKKEEKEFLVLSIDRRPFFLSPVQIKATISHFHSSSAHDITTIVEAGETQTEREREKERGNQRVRRINNEFQAYIA
jgi:hypothetical protein